MLFVEFHGTPAASPSSPSASARSRPISAAARSTGRPSQEDRSRLWQARHDAYWAGRGLRPGAQALATDVCVPISRLAECVTETQGDIAAHGPDRADRRPCRRRQFPSHAAGRHGRSGEVGARQSCASGWSSALAMDGTCTGEHGVGQGKMKYLAASSAARRSTAMAAIKRALDPENIMNPGKIVTADLKPRSARAQARSSPPGRPFGGKSGSKAGRGHRFAVNPPDIAVRSGAGAHGNGIGSCGHGRPLWPGTHATCSSRR